MLPISPQKLYFQNSNEGRFMLSKYVGGFAFLWLLTSLWLSFIPHHTHRRNDQLDPLQAGRLEMKSYTSFIMALYSKPARPCGSHITQFASTSSKNNSPSYLKERKKEIRSFPFHAKYISSTSRIGACKTRNLQINDWFRRSVLLNGDMSRISRPYLISSLSKPWIMLYLLLLRLWRYL